MVYVENAVTKNFRMPKLSVLLAPTLKFTIITNSCYVIPVRWRL